jgi:hypothetical protein
LRWRRLPPEGPTLHRRATATRISPSRCSPIARRCSGGPDGAARRIATRAEIAGWVHGLADRIGTLGSRHRRLAFVVGPLTLDYTDDQLRRLVADAFAVAAETGVAVAFHIDDSMFWSTREAIPPSSANVEWLDWNGTPNTGRRLDWDTQPTRIAPQLCYNSPDVRREVARVARDVIGASIRSEVWKLALQERRALFAGVIVGWESQLGRDFATEGMLGYCALANRGYSLTNPPVDVDAERVQIVHEFVDLWTASIGAAGLSHRELYGHIAFMTRADFEASARSPAPRFASYAEATNFAPANAAFAPGPKRPNRSRRIAGFCRAERSPRRRSPRATGSPR